MVGPIQLQLVVRVYEGLNVALGEEMHTPYRSDRPLRGLIWLVAEEQHEHLMNLPLLVHVPPRLPLVTLRHLMFALIFSTSESNRAVSKVTHR